MTGRPPGARNRVTHEIRDLARVYAPSAVRRLAEIAGLVEGIEGARDNPGAQVSAIKEILDRGYGKSVQPISGEENAPPVSHVVRTVVHVTNPDR